MKKLLISGAILFVSVAAWAQTQPRSGGSTTPNPNETVCRTVGELGSRLARRRVCMTRAEWDERRRENRQATEQAQTWRPK